MALMCHTTPVRDRIAVGGALDIGGKVPKDNTNGLNSTVSATTNGGNDTVTGTASNYENIKRRNTGNSGTSNGTSATVISKVETVQHMDPRAMAFTNSAKCEEVGQPQPAAGPLVPLPMFNRVY